MLRGLSFINQPNQLCEGCLHGKHAQKSFPKKASTRAKKPLKLIHENVCNLIHLNSFGNNKYFLFFLENLVEKLGCIF